MDLAIVIGLTIAFVGIIGGLVMEGGNPASLINIPGLMIVMLRRAGGC